MRLRLIPREERFFDLFVEDAANVLGGGPPARGDAPHLRRSPRRGPPRSGDAEHRGDEISHDIGHRLEATFVTPFDREDIHALISGLDDVLDFIEETADTFVLYRIEAPTATAVQQASIIVKQCEQLHEALDHLRGLQGPRARTGSRSTGSRTRATRSPAEAIADLFADGGDPIEVIKWKDVYGLLEATIDKSRTSRTSSSGSRSSTPSASLNSNRLTAVSSVGAWSPA